MSEHYEIYRAHFSDGEVRGQVWLLQSKHEQIDFKLKSYGPRGLERDVRVNTYSYRLVYQDGENLMFSTDHAFEPLWGYSHARSSLMEDQGWIDDEFMDSAALIEMRRCEPEMGDLPPGWRWDLTLHRIDSREDLITRVYRCRPAFGDVPDGQESLVTLQESPPLAATPAGR